MRKFPNIVNAYALARGDYNDTQTGFKDGTWAIARPLGFASIRQRFRCAWRVFKGEADALIWPGQ